VLVIDTADTLSQPNLVLNLICWFPIPATCLWNSLSLHITAAPPLFAVVLNHISSNFLIPLADSSLIYTGAHTVTYCRFGHYNRYYHITFSQS